MNIVFLGIDLAKNVFQLCGLNQAGKPVYTKRTGRKELLQTLANIPACLIGIEVSTGAFYWQREFEKLGHKVKVISPQYVKPFVRGQKNDGNDAQAIAVALMQPTMQFVPPKSPEQQDIQALHRARQRIVNHRTATVCQIRGLLLDRGIPIGSAVSRVRRAIPLILEDAENGLVPACAEQLPSSMSSLTISGVGSIFLIRKLKQYSGNQKPVSVSPELKALALKRPRPLLLLLAKELNL